MCRKSWIIYLLLGLYGTCEAAQLWPSKINTLPYALGPLQPAPFQQPADSSLALPSPTLLANKLKAYEFAWQNSQHAANEAETTRGIAADTDGSVFTSALNIFARSLNGDYAQSFEIAPNDFPNSYDLNAQNQLSFDWQRFFMGYDSETGRKGPVPSADRVYQAKRSQELARV